MQFTSVAVVFRLYNNDWLVNYTCKSFIKLTADLLTFYKTFAVEAEFRFLKSVVLELMLSSFPYFLSLDMNALSFVNRACYRTIIITDRFILKIILCDVQSVKHISSKQFSLQQT